MEKLVTNEILERMELIHSMAEHVIRDQCLYTNQ